LGICFGRNRSHGLLADATKSRVNGDLSSKP
jgi:hypothetical protein